MSRSIVTRLPLKSLKTSLGSAEGQKDVGEPEIRNLLRAGSIRFVVADVGLQLLWINETDCFDFWKDEVKPHLTEPQSVVSLEDFPGEYFYRASLWHDGGLPIVLLSKSH
jgi:hypothetical protein